MNVREKKVVVTGGVRGLGRAVVEKLLARGSVVSVLDVDGPGLKRARAHPQVHCFPCDLTQPAQVGTAATEYQRVFGAPDVVVNNAGVLHSEPLVRLTGSGLELHGVEAWEKVLAADLSSVFYVTRLLAGAMIRTRTRGVIVNVSSVSAAGNAGQSAYSAAKAGVDALTAVWAKELSPLGIRVVGIAPGFTDTESTAQATSSGALKDILKKVPLGRLGTPDEIAAGILSIVENDFFNGKVLHLDGGLIV